MKKNINLVSNVFLFLSEAKKWINRKEGVVLFLRPFRQRLLKQTITQRLILTAFCISILATAFGQESPKLYYEQGLQKAREGKFEEAIKFFDKTIDLKADHYMAWHDRGCSKLTLRLFKEALADFDQAIKLDPRYEEGWFLRGLAKYQLNDYDGAMADYTHATTLDHNYANAYFERGVANEALGKMDSACTDYKRALQLGLKTAQVKVNMCNNNVKSTKKSPGVSRDANSYYDQGHQKELAGN